MSFELLVTRVIPELVIEPRYRRCAGRSLRRHGGPPAIEVVGLTRDDQQRLLSGLRERYEGVLPVNDPAVPVAEGHVTDCLWYLSTKACGLGCHVANRPPIGFPRFALGLLAHSWAGRDRPSLERIADAHNWLRQELYRAAEEDPGKAAVDRLSGELQQHLTGLGKPGAFVGAVTAVGRFLAARPRADKVALRWWERILRVPRRGAFLREEAVATRLFQAFGAGQGDRGHSREDLLAAAFLADIDAYYGRFRRFNGDRLPLLLLPDSESAEGQEFLATLLRAYDLTFRYPQRGRHPGTRPVLLALGGAGEEALSLPDFEARLDSWRRDVEVRDVRKRWLLRVDPTDVGNGGGRR